MKQKLLSLTQDETTLLIRALESITGKPTAQYTFRRGDYEVYRSGIAKLQKLQIAFIPRKRNTHPQKGPKPCISQTFENPSVA